MHVLPRDLRILNLLAADNRSSDPAVNREGPAGADYHRVPGSPMLTNASTFAAAFWLVTPRLIAIVLMPSEPGSCLWG
jgi:hypothetical protein